MPNISRFKRNYFYYPRDRMVVEMTTTYQSVSNTTKLVSLNPAHVEVYSIQHYVINFVSDLREVGVFSVYSGFLYQ